MENSMNSISKELSYNEMTTECPEESGWTMYFEEFFANNNEENENGSFSPGFEASSLISDAASSVAKKCADNEHVVRLSLEKSCHRLSFKKRKTKGVLVDDALEDTASSLIASPKTCNMMNQLDKNPKQKDIMGISQEKGGTSSQTAERSDQLGFIGRDNDCTELKKNGLCLVPLSLVSKYLG